MYNAEMVEVVGFKDVDSKLGVAGDGPQKDKEWHLRFLYWSHGLTMTISIVFTVIAFTTLFLAIGRCDPWYETSVFDEFHNSIKWCLLP